MRDETPATFNGANATIRAIGRGSRGRVVPGQPAAEAQLAEVHRLLIELRRLLATHAANVHDPDGARSALDAASDEVRTGRPEPRRMRILLNAVAVAAPALGSVAEAVRELILLTSGTP
jgi:hypothetical protein